MLVLTAYIEVLPGDRAPILAALSAVIAATRAEDGCEEYGCYEDTQRSGRFVFVERWRDQAALDRHLMTPHMADWMRVAGPKLTAANGFVYQASSWTELKPE
ncbi:MAG TPA: putative quinol monooxygenase [Gemmatimonadales bacterium]|nr:putative quinol monooxygenase [Gemmatimonadales bacterium]